MKKIPTLFERVFKDHRVVDILPNVTPGMEWVLEGKGVATVKWDGSCCAIINGDLYLRYDCKRGRKLPENAIVCQPSPDPITGHWPCWIPFDADNPGHKWFGKAYHDTCIIQHELLPDGTYEAIGPHFNGNKYDLNLDVMIKHGEEVIKVPRSFEGLRSYLLYHEMEGIVFWLDGEPRCKIKRTDFGYPWVHNGSVDLKSRYEWRGEIKEVK